MKKVLMFLFLCLMIGSAHAFYFTTNTANTQWSGSTTISAGGSSESDYVLISGCKYALLTVGSGTVTGEALWYYSSGSNIFSREALVANTALAVKSTRAKFRLHAATTQTPEAVVYCY